MGKQTRISKMFGALVLGGGGLIQPLDSEASPVEQEPTEQQPVKESPSASDEQNDEAKAPPADEVEEATMDEPAAVVGREDKPVEFCQLEFTLHEYNRDSVDSSKTCLDGKSDAEILVIIEEAKKQTCHSPFCGCWLG